MKTLKALILSTLLLCVSPIALAAPKIDLLYFGATDCPACRLWEAQELPKLQAAPQWQYVKYTKISKSIKAPLPGAFWWPEDVKHLYDAVAAKFKESRIKKGTPMSALLVDGKVVSYGFGSRKIAATHLLPLIDNALASTASK